jgi:hypothetical protein
LQARTLAFSPTEARASAELKGERLKVKGERETEIYSEKKSKPMRSFGGWWIAGGAIAGLLLLFWVRKKLKLFW